MPEVRRGSAPSYTAIRRGSLVVKEIRRGSTLKWSGAVIRDGFDWDGWLTGWINELCGPDFDPGQLISDGLGGLVDGLENEVGRIVQYVEGGINDLGMLVSGTGDQLVSAYCGAWGGTAPPNGLIGLINGIPIFGPILGELLGPWLGGTLEIDSIIGKVPVLGDLAKQIGLIPDDLGNLLEPINYVVDAAGQVVGTLTCGQFKNIAGALLEPICYVIGVVGQAARMLIPDGLMSLDVMASRFRHPTLLANDGFVEFQLAQLGDPGMVTQVFRRYSNDGSGDNGVGIDVRNGTASIVRRVGGNEALVAPGLGGVGPADQLRLVQTGNTHTLYRNGDPLGNWPDNTGTAASGAANASVAMIMQGAKEFGGVRKFSPALAYLEAA